MTDYWSWWASEDGETFTIGPCATREAVIAEATDELLGETEMGDGWRLIFYVAEQHNPPILLSEWMVRRPGVERLLEQAEDWLNDSDRRGWEGDDGAVFEVTEPQLDDLRARLERACDEWQAAHGLVFTVNTFADSRNEETVNIPRPAA